MKVGNIVKWHTATAHFALVGGIVIDTCMIDGLPTPLSFGLIWDQKPIIHMDLTTISRA